MLTSYNNNLITLILHCYKYPLCATLTCTAMSGMMMAPELPRRHSYTEEDSELPVGASLELPLGAGQALSMPGVGGGCCVCGGQQG